MNSDQTANWNFGHNQQLAKIVRKMIVIFVPGLLVTGCGGPTQTTRDNRRLVDAILTAVTIRSSDELTKDKKLLETRHGEGKLSAETQTVLVQIIEKAQTGDWTSAERQLYQFRKRVPFPR